MSLALGLASIGRAGRNFQQERRERTLEDELRRLAGEDRQRKRTLEDAMLAAQDEERAYRKSQRPLDQDYRRAQIESLRGRTAAQGQPKPRNMPASAIEKMVGVDNMISEAENVQRTLEGAIRDKVDATGRVAGVLPTPSWWKDADLSWIGMGPKGGDRGKQTRNIINSLKGQIAKERAGTAMSPAELDLLESYIPSDNVDETTALGKAREFLKTLNRIKANRESAYRKYGLGALDDELPPDERDERLPYPHE